MWRKVAWGYVLNPVLSLIPFFAVKLILHATTRALVGPYLGFVAVQLIFLTVVPWLWKWEAQGAPPKRLALAWGLMLTLFSWGVTAVSFYTVMSLHILARDAAFWVLGMMAIVGTATSPFVGYRMTMERISSRASATAG